MLYSAKGNEMYDCADVTKIKLSSIILVYVQRGIHFCQELKTPFIRILLLLAIKLDLILRPLIWHPSFNYIHVIIIHAWRWTYVLYISPFLNPSAAEVTFVKCTKKAKHYENHLNPVMYLPRFQSFPSLLSLFHFDQISNQQRKS